MGDQVEHLCSQYPGSLPPTLRMNIPLVCSLLVLMFSVSELKKPNKPNKPKPVGCKFNEGSKLSNKEIAKYTLSPTGCQCWWDITSTDCACCKPDTNSMQCGFPMHNACWKKEKYGCPGICNNKYTLSTKGYPCYSDRLRTDCAWCTPAGWQCIKNKATGPDARGGNRCAPRNQQKYCESQQADCKHIPGCDINAKCNFKQQVGVLKHFQCECNKEDDYIGNGIQCMNNVTGEMSFNPDMHVEVTMTLVNENYTFPAPEELTVGETMENLVSQMESTNTACSSQGCESTFTNTEA